jgi:hypothetical protein
MIQPVLQEGQNERPAYHCCLISVWDKKGSISPGIAEHSLSCHYKCDSKIKELQGRSFVLLKQLLRPEKLK